jgi:hypothetical protein
MYKENSFWCAVLLLFFFFPACRNGGSEPSSEPLFTLLTAATTGINFTNQLRDSKDDNVFAFRNYYNGGGVAVGDVNNDGLQDVFFTANMGPNKLYLNKGSLSFDDISEKAGFDAGKKEWSTGVVMVDINNDGWLDIYVSNSAHINDGISKANQLFINNHDLTFTDKAAAYGLNDTGFTTQASFFDYDLDGDLDCFIINNSPIPVNTLNYANKRDIPAQNWEVKSYLRGGGDHLYRNDAGEFTEVTQSAGIHGSLISLGLGVTVGDVNDDGYPDIYVSNDFFERDYLYINQQNGTFTDELEQWVQHISLSSMGADLADINNDGYPDLFTTDMMPDDEYRLKTTSSFDNIDVYNLKEKSGFYHQFQQNTLQLNNGNNKFLEIAHYSGVQASDWSWGGLIFDADNDGNQDIFVCNGIYRDVTDQDFIDFFANDVVQKMVTTGEKKDVSMVIDKMPVRPIPNKMYKNNGNLHFTDIGKDWGLAQPSHSNGAVYSDLDNDGDLDLVVSNVNAPAFVYKNNSNKNKQHHYVSIELRGDTANLFAIGSKIQLYTAGQVLSREVIPSRGFQSSVDYRQTIGTGKFTHIDSVIIRWPDRSESKYENLQTDSAYHFKKPAQKIPFRQKIETGTSSFFKAATSFFQQHTEDDYIDFYYERNLPALLSREGPKAAVADVNGDGMTDVYIGGAAKQAGQLYLQSAGEKFVPSRQAVFDRFADFEDVAVLFFDCDNDGDQDLFVGSGGNNLQADISTLQHRLYKNDGKGNFSIDTEAFPENRMNIAVAAAHDVNGDGFTDLFVASRSIPGRYGADPVHYLFINDGKGHFKNTAQNNTAIAAAGMITGAVWADVVGDAQKELVVVGEYMPPKIFTLTATGITEVSTNLVTIMGWWQSVAVADMDGDGKQDLVLGNVGENFYLRPSVDSPVRVWLNDFDNNGSFDNILTRTVAGKDMPVFMKREMVDQFPILKKQNLRNDAYAAKTIQELFGPDIMSKSRQKQFNYTSTCIAFNDGNGNFTLQKLPAFTQFSSVNAILPTDMNGDGKLDLLLGGNLFTFPPQFCSLDASYGNILLNEGKRNFSVVAQRQAGIEWRGQVKDIKTISVKTGNLLLVLQNNEVPLLYRMQPGAVK